MIRHAWLASVLAAGLLACPLAFGAGEQAEAQPEKKPKKARPRKEKSFLRGEYRIMAAVLEMDEAQKAKLVEALKANHAALLEWKAGPDGRKLEELMKARNEARSAKQKDKLKQVEKEMASLRDAVLAIQKAGKRRILAVLTDEQKTRWTAFGIERSILRKFSRSKLTDEQKKLVKEISLRAVKAEPFDEDDKKARSAVYKKVAAQVEKEVLTDAQRESATKPSRREEEDPRSAGKG